MRGTEKIVRLSTKMLGDHNIENIVGVSAMLLEQKLLTPVELNAGMSTFHGREAPDGIALAVVEGARLRRLWIVLREGPQCNCRNQAALSPSDG